MTDRQAIRFCAETFAAQHPIPHTQGGMVAYLEKFAEAISKSTQPILVKAERIHAQMKELAALPPARAGKMQAVDNG